jgi:hypothetical protein
MKCEYLTRRENANFAAEEQSCIILDTIGDSVYQARGGADSRLHYRSPESYAHPFPWMDTISLEAKTNFFEKRVSEYAKSGVSGPTDSKHHVFSLDEQF